MSEPTDEPDPDAAEWLTDLLYTGVGLGILAINRAQGARRDVESMLADADPANPGVLAIHELLSDPQNTERLFARLRVEIQDLDDRLDGFENRFAAMLDNIETELPPGAQDLSRALRDLAIEHAAQIRSVLGLEAR